MVAKRRTNGANEGKETILRAVITFFALIIVSLWAFPQVIQAEDISIDSYFPDENFRAYCKAE